MYNDQYLVACGGVYYHVIVHFFMQNLMFQGILVILKLIYQIILNQNQKLMKTNLIQTLKRNGKKMTVLRMM